MAGKIITPMQGSRLEASSTDRIDTRNKRVSQMVTVLLVRAGHPGLRAQHERQTTRFQRGIVRHEAHRNQRTQENRAHQKPPRV